MSGRITLEEQEQILLTALGLIREPENWVAGKWKCPVPQLGPRGGMTRKQKRDDNNQPVFQYCIEGAINQATYNVLGEERAMRLGAVYMKNGKLAFDSPVEQGTPAETLKLNEIAYDLYAEEMGWGSSSVGRGQRGLAMAINDQTKSHEKVITILKTRLAQVGKSLRRKQKATV